MTRFCSKHSACSHQNLGRYIHLSNKAWAVETPNLSLKLINGLNRDNRSQMVEIHNVQRV